MELVRNIKMSLRYSGQQAQATQANVLLCLF